MLTLRGIVYQSDLRAAASEFLGDGAAAAVGEGLGAAVGAKRHARGRVVRETHLEIIEPEGVGVG